MHLKNKNTFYTWNSKRCGFFQLQNIHMAFKCQRRRNKAPFCHLNSAQHTLFIFPVEMATLTRKDNKTMIRVLTSAEVEKLIAAFEKSEAEAEAAKKAQTKS